MNNASSQFIEVMFTYLVCVETAKFQSDQMSNERLWYIEFFLRVKKEEGSQINQIYQ